jgi:PAS domain S-box-containing protein
MSHTGNTVTTSGDARKTEARDEAAQQAALFRTDVLQKAIHNSANFSSIATDAKGVIQIFNVGAERLLGYSAIEVLNKFTPLDLHDKDEIVARSIALSTEFGVPIASDFEALAFRASRGEDDIYELTKIRKDGSRFPAIVSVSALRDDHNVIIGYLLIGSDNTARKQAEARLRISEIRYRRLFETAHDGVLLVDPVTRKITDANPFMTKLLGYKHEQLVGKELFEIGLLKDELASQAMVEELKKQHAVRYENLPLKSQDGMHQEVEVVANLYDEDGHAVIQCNIRDITERKRTEAELSESNAMFSNVFKSNMVGMGLWTKDGAILDANDALLNLLGFTREEFMAKPLNWLMLTPPEFRQQDEKAIAEIDLRGVCEPIEKEYFHKDGRRIPVLVGAARLNKSSRVGSFFAIDLSERKRSEAALRASEAKLHLGAAVAGLGIGMMDYRADTITMDETAARLFALPQDKPIPRHDAHARFHPDDVPAITAKIAECLDEKGNGFMTLDHRIIRPDGSMRWVSARKQVEFAIDAEEIKRPTVGLLVLLDITERIKSTESLRESEERMRLATKATGVGIWEWNVLTGRIRWDPVMFRIYGVTPSEDGFVTYDTWRNAVLPQDLPEQESLLQDVIRKPGQTTRTFRICKSGVKGVRTIEAVDTARTNAMGQVEWVIGTNLDITDRKEAEMKLHEATMAAEQANQAKSDFLSSMSHELRSPLHAILGFTQLIESGAPLPTPAQKNSIDQILHAGWYLLELINEILDLAMIESGKVSMSIEATSLAEILSECEAMIEPQANKSGVKVVFPPVERAPFISADRTRVKQVFINLLSNAIKYNRVGGTVTVTYAARTARRTRISFRDTGEGLSAEKMSQLFQPFNRLGQDTGSTEGTGIGLALSKSLVDFMGGEIGAESTVGVGSIFWVELNSAADPAMTATEAEAEAEFKAEIKAAMSASALTSPPPHRQAGSAIRTLLCVEDNPANLMLVERLIARRPDIRLLTASDGQHGLEIARASHPDVILMDINLPGMSGIDVLEILAEDRATAHIPVIALSANAMPRDVEIGLAAGFFRYVTKPIKVNDFMATLDVAFKFAATISAYTNNERTPSNP